MKAGHELPGCNIYLTGLFIGFSDDKHQQGTLSPLIPLVILLLMYNITLAAYTNVLISHKHLIHTFNYLFIPLYCPFPSSCSCL